MLKDQQVLLIKQHTLFVGDLQNNTDVFSDPSAGRRHQKQIIKSAFWWCDNRVVRCHGYSNNHDVLLTHPPTSSLRSLHRSPDFLLCSDLVSCCHFNINRWSEGVLEVDDPANPMRTPTDTSTRDDKHGRQPAASLLFTCSDTCPEKAQKGGKRLRVCGRPGWRHVESLFIAPKWHVYGQETAPSNVHSDYGGSKGGSQVTLQGRKVHKGRLDESTKNQTLTQEGLVFPVFNCQSTTVYFNRDHDRSQTLTTC